MDSDNREALAEFLLRLRSSGITDHRLLTAFEDIPRRNFVPVIHVTEAYARGQMPIECGQSMTAVSMVAKVLAALEVDASHRVLELGTGTGYQAALLGRLATKVVSVERFRTLFDKAKDRLSQLRIENVFVKLIDGSQASAELGLSDRIVSNFAFPEVPKSFIDNLASNGVMIAPIGEPGELQIMKRLTKVGSRFHSEDLFPVRTQPYISGISKAI
jgi:protein-L-isoaspartate(D-aspartate) O-methyltransferase